MHVEVLRGSAIEKHILELGRLRIEVFAEWPYLYAGSLEYERKYLEHFARAPSAVLVLARDAGQVIGASTAVALAAEPATLTEPFARGGARVAEWFYLAESVLKREYRGQGLGHRFFDEREAAGRALGFERFTFCAVERAPDDARRPPHHFEREPFWRKRGYTPSELFATLSWREHDEASESAKALRFWVKLDAPREM